MNTLKKTLIKCADYDSNVYEALLNLRNTSWPSTGLGPVQLMMNCGTQIILPMAKLLPKPSTAMDTTRLRRQCQINMPLYMTVRQKTYHHYMRA